jgi:hypothetical protein
VEQRLFQLLPTIPRFASVGFDIEASKLQPVGNLIGAAHGQCVDDAVTLQRVQLFCEPGEPFSLARQPYRLQRK